VSKLFEFCNIPYENQTSDFIKTSTTESVAHTYGVYKRRTKDLDWKKELPIEIQQEILHDLESFDFSV
jgi:hypothetical protein